MATYDPQRGHARPKPADDEPAPVDELLDVAGDAPAPADEPALAGDAAPDGGSPADEPEPEPEPVAAAPRPAVVAEASPAPSQVGGTPRRLPAKKVGAGVALTAVLFALSWALRRKRRNRGG